MRISIKAILVGMFAILTIVSAIQGLVSIKALQTNGESTNVIITNAIPSLNQASRINRLILQVRTAQLRFLTAPNDAIRKEDLALAHELMEARTAELDKYKVLIASSTEQAAYDDLIQTVGALKQDWSKLLRIAETNADQALVLFRTENHARYRAAAAAATRLVDLNFEVSKAAGEAAQIQQTQAIHTAIAMLVAGLVVTILAMAFSIFGVARPIEQMTRAMRDIASGDTDREVPSKGRRNEIGEMASTVEVFRTNLIHTRKLEEDTALARASAEEQRKAGMRQMADHFETMVSGIIGMVTSSASQLQATARSMSGTATETASQSLTVASAAEEAAANVQTVAAAAEELGASVQEIGRQVASSADLAESAVGEADHTAVLVQNLSNAAAQINNVVAMISTIAGQTNLLALNATIEAARAGEAGRGFAVVASEVKELANQTSRATDEIASQIGTIQGATGQAVAAIGGIASRIREINGVASSIAAAVEQQGAATQEIVRNVAQAAIGTGEVTTNITSVAGAAEETGAAASQVLSAAAELSRQSENLSTEVQRFLATVRAA
ncbi:MULTISPECIES: methyl-accepting chemotaxis protein [Methylorubrum]|jgi:methyl-accepting chemotaxis protein|uniref:Methyl-accepting chemotaxis sensory transducer n=3 Tax=Methylorubrum extorquens TaxID=408 RepID=B7KX27_METC4|nr:MULTISPECIES: methyl-accepting chemotaxis protein [Methylorubrum]ACK84552.1 methyl-accepting chemotaxis sensory transducer [Methylorubrum extorquens CM4]MCY1643084.1 methyl-accepting chemotaxis protein [Methylorubrum sp. SL192]